MKKSQILALILGGMLTVQNTAALAMTSGAYGTDNYISKLYSSSAGTMTAEELNHKEKAELLKKYGLVTEALLKDETKTVTYSDAVRALAGFFGYSEDMEPETSYKEFFIFAVDAENIETGIEIKDDDTEIPIGILSDLCLLTAGYTLALYPERTELAVKNGLMTDKDDEKSAVTVERFIDIIYTALNIPICVIDSWDVTFAANDATPIATPIIVILDGGKNEDGTERALITRLMELEENEARGAEQEEENTSSDTANESADVSGSLKELTTEEKIGELQELGIIAKTDDLRLGDNVSRAETAKILAVISGFSSSFADPQSIFADVPSGHWACEYIEYSYTMGILEGDQGLFRPEDNVSFAEICKMLVCASGYQSYAENIGGYPNGYISEAVTLGLTEGLGAVSANDMLTREQIMLMTYNSLDVPLVLIDSWTTTETPDGPIMTPVLIIADGKDGREFMSLRTRMTENE